MTTRPVTVAPSASIKQAVQLMLDHHISGLPVVDGNGELLGMITEGDLLHRSELRTDRKRPWWRDILMSPGRSAEEYVHAHGCRVGELMSTDVKVTSLDAELLDVVESIETYNIKRLPVVDRGRLVGIIARADILRALLNVLPESGSAFLDDQQIRSAILAELKHQSWGRSGMIDAIVRFGHVELTGSVLDERERLAARVLAENISGVKSVTNNLQWIEPMSGMAVTAPEMEDQSGSPR
ncbi:CBS domain-containing protein [Rhodoligotrophos appendicifer]|uniref:CBS domain-containing protein n=1 Tax=Rhodoligotrophos appendicifer TaxID=987056 RepID=UPI001FE78751|nr:CBS domain-containing protein [Rhodoligotrophos appendicifer]